MIQTDIKVENKRVREELEKDMKYLLEKKAELEREVKAGELARERLDEVIEEFESVTIAWIGSKYRNKGAI